MDEKKIEENTRYVFPEFEQPYEAPNLQELEDDGVDYSVNPEHLGAMNVVLTGAQFIDELDKRDLTDTIGKWSE